MKDDIVAGTPGTPDAPARTGRATGWHPFDTLRREIDHLFEGFGAGGMVPGAGRLAPALAGMRAPALDLHEAADAYTLTAELPGVGRDDIEVKLERGHLVIRGEKRAETTGRKGECVVSERSYGRFSRSLALPEDVDSKAIAASFEDGVLSVTLPRSAETDPASRRIEIGKT